jgi:putative FmdB family regulatory protein
MPLYEYECDACGHRFEHIHQKFSEPPIEKCPTCGGHVHKLMSSPAIQFKGSGFYITDYAKKDSPSAGQQDEKGDAKSESKGETTGEAKTDSKGESKSESKSETKSEGKGDAKSETKPSSSSSGDSAAGKGAPTKPSAASAKSGD